MYRAVKKFCASNEAVWENLPAFVVAFVLFNSKLETLEQLILDQDHSLLGVKDVKDQKRKETADFVHRVASALRSIGKKTGDTSLQAHLDFPEWELYYGASAVTLKLMDRVKQAALDNAPLLITDYNISHAEIDDLVLRVNQLQADFGSTRDAIVSRGRTTQLIKELIAEIDEVLKWELDMVVEVIKHDQHEFAVGYKLAREVVDLNGKKHKSGTDELPPEA